MPLWQVFFVLLCVIFSAMKSLKDFMNKPFFFIFYFKIKLQKINGLRLLRNLILVVGFRVLALEEIKVYNGIDFFPEKGALEKHLKVIFVGFLLSNNYVLVKLKKMIIS